MDEALGLYLLSSANAMFWLLVAVVFLYLAGRNATPFRMYRANRSGREEMVKMKRTPKAPPIPEKDVIRVIVDWFATIGIELHRRNTGAMKASYGGKSRFVRFSKPGQADLWGIQSGTGRHIEIEVKRMGKTPSDEQQSWLEHCRETGAIAFWANSLEMARIGWGVALDRKGWEG